ncbi:hypothetical protein LDENG_00092210 [Lucifuga dentata]|nr:hypothetical protein LDENG_00092210 [Lucifuga dentata]
MPWKQDMKNRRLLMKNAVLAGIPVVPHEESLFFCGRERLCHVQDSQQLAASSSSLSSSFPLHQTGIMAQNSSHFSRYNSSVVTTRRLYQTQKHVHVSVLLMCPCARHKTTTSSVCRSLLGCTMRCEPKFGSFCNSVGLNAGSAV